MFQKITEYRFDKISYHKNSYHHEKFLFFSQFQFFSAVSMMEMIDETVGLDGSKLIDIGCGCGMLMTSAATLYDPETVLGVDIDEDALATCSRNLETAEITEKYGGAHLLIEFFF